MFWGCSAKSYDQNWSFVLSVPLSMALGQKLQLELPIICSTVISILSSTGLFMVDLDAHVEGFGHTVLLVLDGMCTCDMMYFSLFILPTPYFYQNIGFLIHVLPFCVDKFPNQFPNIIRQSDSACVFRK